MTTQNIYVFMENTEKIKISFLLKKSALTGAMTSKDMTIPLPTIVMTNCRRLQSKLFWYLS